MKQAKEPIRRLCGYLGKHWPDYMLGTVLQIASGGGMELILAWMLARLTNSAVNRNLSSLMTVIGWSLLGVWMISMATPLAAWWRSRAVERSMVDLRQELFDHLQVLPISYFEQVHSGDIVSRLTNDITAAKEAVGDALIRFLGAIVTGVVCGVAMWWISWKFAVLGLLLGLLPLWFNRLTVPGLQKVNHRAQESLAELNSRLKDLLAGFPVVKAFVLESRMAGSYDEANRRARQNDLERVRLQTITIVSNDFLGSFSFLAILVLGGYLLVKREVTPGAAIAACQLLNGFSRPFATLGDLWVRLQTARAAVVRVFEVMDQPSEQWNRTDTGATSQEEIISLRDVTFAFDNKPVLRGISLHVSRGQVVALVGPSGGGKSTVLKLLLGFHQPAGGTITVAGRRLTDYGVAELREQMAFVPQEAYLYAGTIYDNIACGRLGATEAQVYAAAGAANAHEFIMQLPEGYQTQVGERGAQLSGGQRQRIAIARAILKDAPILLLDEATSSLDSESERLVQNALERLMVGRTTVVIAHRLTTIRQADCIHVVVDGQIAESGNHEQLMERDGVYRHLNEIQVGAVA